MFNQGIIHASVVLIGLAATSGTAWAATELADEYACVPDASPEKAVSKLIAAGVVPAKPTVTADSISHFAARPGFTALGYELVEVQAYQGGSKLLAPGRGTLPPTQFAFVVRAIDKEVARAMDARGLKTGSQNLPFDHPILSVARAQRPAGADASGAYAIVTCRVQF